MVKKLDRSSEKLLKFHHISVRVVVIYSPIFLVFKSKHPMAFKSSMHFYRCSTSFCIYVHLYILTYLTYTYLTYIIYIISHLHTHTIYTHTSMYVCLYMFTHTSFTSLHDLTTHPYSLPKMKYV